MDPPPLLKSDDLFFREPRDIGPPPPFKNPGHAPDGKPLFLYSYLIRSKGDLHVAKYSDCPDSNKISKKTFPLSFISEKNSITHYALIMNTCSNVEIIITFSINSSVFTQ